MDSKAVVVVGPTCTGKTTLSVELSKEFNGSIVSADSRQVVKYMDIGTGKTPFGSGHTCRKFLDRSKLDGVDVFGYDLVNPDAFYSAYDFYNYSKRIFSELSHEGKTVFLVGGTGFYIDVVTGRLSIEGSGPDIEFRQSLEGCSAAELAEKLRVIDPLLLEMVDNNNPARLIRALEKKRSESNSLGTGALLKPLTTIGLCSSREELYRRADSWVESVFSEPLFKEVRSIKEKFPNSSRLSGLVYKSVVDYLHGNMELEQACQRAKFDMHAYIRRQLTWFKRNPEITWVDISEKNFDSKVKSIVESVING